MELEAEAPVAGVEAADAGDQAGQAGELDGGGLGEQVGADRERPVEQAAGQADQVVEGRDGSGGRIAVDLAARRRAGSRASPAGRARWSTASSAKVVPTASALRSASTRKPTLE